MGDARSRSSETAFLGTCIRAARLWVQLDWHAQQAWLGSFEESAEEARRIWEELVGQACAAAGARKRSPFHATLLGQRERWIHGYESADRKEARETANAKLEKPSLECDVAIFAMFSAGRRLNGKAHDQPSLREKLCAALLEPSRQSLRAVRTALWEKLDSRSRLAWDLGECVEHGLYPPDVFLHMGKPTPSRRRTREEYLAEVADAYHTSPGPINSPVPRHKEFLAPSRLNPGDLPVKESWPGQVLAAWTTLFPGEQPPQEFLDAVKEGLGDRDVGDLVGLVADAAVGKLRDEGKRSESGHQTVAVFSCGDTCHTLQIGERQPVSIPEGYKDIVGLFIQKILIGAPTEVVDWKALNEKAGEKETLLADPHHSSYLPLGPAAWLRC
jgi:hypothetical protein